MAKRKVVAIGITSIVLVIIIGAITWLLVSGRVEVTFKGGTSRQITDGSVVCSNDDVVSFNDKTEFKDRGGSVTVDQKGLSDLAGAIVNRDGYKADPTCQTIIFWSANYNDDAPAAERALAEIRKLYANNRFANSNISLIKSLDEYQAIVNRLYAPDSYLGGN